MPLGQIMHNSRESRTRLKKHNRFFVNSLLSRKLYCVKTNVLALREPAPTRFFCVYLTPKGPQGVRLRKTTKSSIMKKNERIAAVLMLVAMFVPTMSFAQSVQNKIKYFPALPKTETVFEKKLWAVCSTSLEVENVDEQHFRLKEIQTGALFHATPVDEKRSGYAWRFPVDTVLAVDGKSSFKVSLFLDSYNGGYSDYTRSFIGPFAVEGKIIVIDAYVVYDGKKGDGPFAKSSYRYRAWTNPLAVKYYNALGLKSEEGCMWKNPFSVKYKVRYVKKDSKEYREKWRKGYNMAFGN